MRYVECKENVASLFRNKENTSNWGAQNPKTLVIHKPSTSKEVVKLEKKATTSHLINLNTSKCFKCQGYDNIASNCRNRRVMVIVKGENQKVPNEEKDGAIESL